MHVLVMPSWYPEDDSDFNGTFFREQAAAMAAEGHKVGIIAVRGFPIYQLGEYRKRSRDISVRDEDGLTVLRTNRLLPVPKFHALNYRVMNRAWRALYDRYVSEFGVPDVLHVHTVFPAGIGAEELSRTTGIPYVITEHRISSRELLRSRALYRRGKRTVDNASALVAVAPQFDGMLNEAYSVHEAPFWEYRPGLLSPQFEDIAPRTAPTGPFIVGHVSHLADHKRIPLLIEGFADAFRGQDDVRLRIAGTSPEVDDFKALAAAEGIQGQVDFVGAVSRDAIADEFSRYHVFAMTSVTEAFGTVLWEAMACGIPLVSTDTWAGMNAIRENNGLLVPTEDRQALAEALVRMRDNFDDFDDPARIRKVALDHCGHIAFTKIYDDIFAAVTRSAR